MPSKIASVFNIGQVSGKMAKLQEDRVNVERAMFMAHTFNFLLSAGKACLLPFLTIYFRLLGLTATQVGLIFAAQAFMKFWCAPLWSSCAKQCRKKKFVLMFSTFVLLSSVLLLSLAPPVDPDNSPLYCRTKHQNSSDLQSDEHENLNPSNETALAVNPSLKTSTESQAAVDSAKITTPAAADDEMNKEVNDMVDENEKSSTTTTSTTIPKVTTFKPVVHYSTSTTTQVPLSTTTAAIDTQYVLDLLDKLGLNIDDMSEDDLKQLLESQISENDENDNEQNKEDEDYQFDNNDDDNEDEDDYDYNWGNNKWNSMHHGMGGGRTKRHAEPESTKTESESAKHESDSEKAESDSAKPESESSKTELESAKTWTSTFYGYKDELFKEKNKTFVFILALLIVAEFFAAPAEKLADDCWFEYLDILDVLEKYNQHRIWKTVGYIMMPAFVATVVEKTNCVLAHSIPHFMIHFFTFAAFAGLAFMVAFGYPISQNKKTPKQSRFGKGVRILCCDIHSLTLTLTVFILGMIYAAIDNFLYWKVQDVGGSEIVIGVSIMVSATSSVLMLVVQSALIKRITYIGAVVLALLTLAGRLVFYSFLWTPWVVLAGDALHGFSHTLIFGALQMYPDFRINPFIMDRSAHTLLNVLYYGLGTAVGSAMSGLLYDQFGFALLFQGACVFVTSWCALFLIFQKCIKKKSKIRYAKLLQDDHGDDDSSDYEDDWLEVAMKTSSR